MGQVLHGCATTTEAVRRAIQNSQESLRALANRYGINQKTVRKWRNRSSATDLPTGPKKPRSTVLSVEEEAVVVAFRRHTLLPLDDCLYALQASFNARLRDELLDGEIFYSLAEARIVIESWRRHYNTDRPHGSLDYKPPAPEVFIPAFAARAALQPRPATPPALAERPTIN